MPMGASGRISFWDCEGTRRRACLSCVHLYVTWDPRFPRGCRALGFKSRELPCTAVAQASGQDCLYFEPSPRTRR
jgi:hypothetical protein